MVGAGYGMGEMFRDIRRPELLARIEVYQRGMINDELRDVLQHSLVASEVLRPQLAVQGSLLPAIGRRTGEDRLLVLPLPLLPRGLRAIVGEPAEAHPATGEPVQPVGGCCDPYVVFQLLLAQLGVRIEVRVQRAEGKPRYDDEEDDDEESGEKHRAGGAGGGVVVVTKGRQKGDGQEPGRRSWGSSEGRCGTDARRALTRTSMRRRLWWDRRYIRRPETAAWRGLGGGSDRPTAQTRRNKERGSGSKKGEERETRP